MKVEVEQKKMDDQISSLKKERDELKEQKKAIGTEKYITPLGSVAEVLTKEAQAKIKEGNIVSVYRDGTVVCVDPEHADAKKRAELSVEIKKRSLKIQALMAKRPALKKGALVETRVSSDPEMVKKRKDLRKQITAQKRLAQKTMDEKDVKKYHDLVAKYEEL